MGAQTEDALTQPQLNAEISEELLSKPARREYKWNIVWRNVIFLSLIHIYGIYGMYDLFFKSTWPTFIWMYFMCTVISLGGSAGSHRLYSHRSYKAKAPLRYFLVSMHAALFQNTMVFWVKDHRTHHRFTDTDADPHSAKRGFFFSHMGWVMIKKLDDVKKGAKTVDISDVANDPAVQFQKDYYWYLALFFGFAVPAGIPYLFFGEPGWSCVHMTVARYVMSLHATWAVNSVTHKFGTKPYDTTIMPTQNKIVSYFSCGEGYHNFHHVFPWDYRSDEFGRWTWNNTSMFLDCMAWLGQAYDLKTASPDLVAKRMSRTGTPAHDPKKIISWGWGDCEMEDEEYKGAKILNKLAVS